MFGILKFFAQVAELAYAEDLKSSVFQKTCGFESHPGHDKITKSGSRSAFLIFLSDVSNY